MVAPASVEPAIWSRIIQLDANNLDVRAAEHLLTWDFAPADHARMAELSEKAQLGTLTEDELAEAQTYNHVGHALALLQSKARRCLKLAGQ